MNKIYANKFSTLYIGRQGENLATQVVFDISDWISQYGSGVAELIYKRTEDEQPYPIAVDRDGNTILWTVNAVDTAVPNYGKCELRYYVGETLVKSAIWQTRVISALDTPSEEAPPEPQKGWVDQVLTAGAAAEKAAASAKDDANRAEQAAVNPPKLSEDDTWMLWNPDTGVYDDTGVLAEGTPGKDGQPGRDGRDGVDGAPGKDGYTPVKGIDYFDGAPGKDGRDGKDGQPGANGASGVYCGSTEPGEEYDVWIDPNGEASSIVSDVQIDGASIAKDGIANIPKATMTQLGVVGINTYWGISAHSNGNLRIVQADQNNINSRDGYYPITPHYMDYAVKAAMCDGQGTSWTDAEKTGAWKRLNSIKTTMDDIAVAGAQYYLGEQGAVSVVLPDDAEVGQMVAVCWYNGATAATLSITGTMLAFDYTPSANTRSEINALWDGTYWAVIGNEMEVPSE